MSVTGWTAYRKGDAYTLKLEMTSFPLGSAVNKKDDNAIAASIAIKQVDMKANPLFTRAYKLCIPLQASSGRRGGRRGQGTGTSRGLTLTIWGTTPPEVA